MSTSCRVVEVLCPNGRCVKVACKSQMTVSQILAAVCSKQTDFVEDEYDIKHHRKVLSVQSMVRYLNLPNNAKLELIKRDAPRKASLQEVTVALQMEDGDRHQVTCPMCDTLLDVIERVRKERNIELITMGLVCVYMSNEYKGESVLQSTTLQSIGITGGRIVLRLHYRKGGEEKDAPKEHPEPNIKKVKLDAIQPALTTSSVHPPSTIHQSHSSVSTGPPSRSIFPDESPVATANEISTDVASAGQQTSEVDSISDFSDFKFPEPTVLEYHDLAIDPQEMREQVLMSMPCDRQPVVYSLETSASKDVRGSDQADFDEDFFALTLDDLRVRMKDLENVKTGTEEVMLMTKQMREKKRMEKIMAMKKVIIRFLLPDQTFIQAFFRPLETVNSLIEFLRDYITVETKAIQLFVTPPKIVLKDKEQTLYEAKLVPMALLHVTSSIHSPRLKAFHLENLKTSSYADSLIYPTQHRVTNGEKRWSLTSQPSSSKPMKPPTDAVVKSGPKGAPKWFKTR